MFNPFFRFKNKTPVFIGMTINYTVKTHFIALRQAPITTQKLQFSRSLSVKSNFSYHVVTTQTYQQLNRLL